MKTFLIILITALLAAGGTWFALQKLTPPATSSGSTAERKPVFYQSAMHPWIKSDKPGRCTICGMELTPVYEGEKGFDDSGGGNFTTNHRAAFFIFHLNYFADCTLLYGGTSSFNFDTVSFINYSYHVVALNQYRTFNLVELYRTVLRNCALQRFTNNFISL